MSTFPIKRTITALLSALAMTAQVLSVAPAAFAAAPSCYFYNEDGHLVEDGQVSPIRYSGIWSQGTYYSFEELTHDSRYSDCEIIPAIDVSRHQGVIDWNAVAAQGIRRAYVRVGLRGWGAEGYLGTDTQFVNNLIGAKNAGLEVGAYFYTQALNPAEAVEEAEFALSILASVPGYTLDLPLYYDVEKAESGYEIGRVEAACLTQDEFTANCRAFCSVIESAGLQAGIYACPDYLTNKLHIAELEQEYDIWLAHYTTQTYYTGQYSVWQFCDGAYLSGISEAVDLDVSYVPRGTLTAPSIGSGLAAPSLSDVNAGGGLTAPPLDEVSFGDELAAPSLDEVNAAPDAAGNEYDGIDLAAPDLSEITWDNGEPELSAPSLDDITVPTQSEPAPTESEPADMEPTPVKVDTTPEGEPVSANYIASGMTLHEIGETVMPILAGEGAFDFFSSDPSVAEVAADGTITAVGKGEAVITAYSANGTSDSITITVGLNTHVALSSSLLLFDSVGGEEQIEFAASPEYALVSSDTEVFTVSPEGLVVATGFGTAELILVDPDGTQITCTIVVPLEAPALGDCNLDGCVNASDASDILAFAAENGSGSEGSTLTQAHQTVFDCNGDGIIDASDAAELLMLCASYGAGE